MQSVPYVLTYFPLLVRNLTSSSESLYTVYGNNFLAMLKRLGYFDYNILREFAPGYSG